MDALQKTTAVMAALTTAAYIGAVVINAPDPQRVPTKGQEIQNYLQIRPKAEPEPRSPQEAILYRIEFNLQPAQPGKRNTLPS